MQVLYLDQNLSLVSKINSKIICLGIQPVTTNGLTVVIIYYHN